MPDRSPSDPDSVTLPFVFVPDGEPMPEAVRHFRDPIMLRARLEPGPRGSEAGSETAGINNRASPESLAPPSDVSARIPGAYDVAQNGSDISLPSRPSGLTSVQRNAIVAVAQDWAAAHVPYAPATDPLSGRHASLQGADCSGAIYAIYNGAGIPIEYFDTRHFRINPSFTALAPGSTPEVGDVLWWPGHVAIHAGENGGDGYKIWTATSPGGSPFGLSLSKYQWGSVPAGTPPVVYRYNGR